MHLYINTYMYCIYNMYAYLAGFSLPRVDSVSLILRALSFGVQKMVKSGAV